MSIFNVTAVNSLQRPWPLQIKNSAVLEVVLPNEAVVLKRNFTAGKECEIGSSAGDATESPHRALGSNPELASPSDVADTSKGAPAPPKGDPTTLVGDDSTVASGCLAEGIQSVVLDPAPECMTKLLALAVDHIDTLLEDWSVAAVITFQLLNY